MIPAQTPERPRTELMTANDVAYCEHRARRTDDGYAPFFTRVLATYETLVASQARNVELVAELAGQEAENDALRAYYTAIADAAEAVESPNEEDSK